MAAMCDGINDVEREHLGQICQRLSPGSGATPPADLFRAVVLRQTDLTAEVAKLTTPADRRAAFEMCLSICAADGPISPGEDQFLRQLQAGLRLTDDEVVDLRRHAEAIAAAPSASMRAQATVAPAAAAHEGGSGPHPASPPIGQAGDQRAGQPESQRDGQLNSSILNYATLCAALELLPQSLATMAIVPLQSKMVYAIGARFGYSLDAGHIKELTGVLGVGLAGQVLEGFASKLLSGAVRGVAGGIFGGLAGRIAGGLTETVTGPALTFATTYAIGMVAKQYYSGGRSLSAIDLKTAFVRELSAAKSLYEQHAGSIRARASGLDASQILNVVRAA